jgi:hypothetical protein
MKKLLLLLLLLLLTSGLWAQTPTNFDLVAYEGFDYVSGTSLFNASSGNGWTSNWEQSYQQQYLKTSTTGFTYAGLTTAGKKAEWDSNCYGGSCNGIASLKRAFPLQNSGVVYFQFISVLESSGGFGTPNIRLYNSTTLTGGFGASTGTKMSILNAGLANLSSSSENLNAQNLVVVRIDYNLNKTEMWINPNLTTFDYSNPTGPSATANIAPEFDSFQLFMRSGSIDEVSIFKSITGLNRYGKITSTNADFVNKNGAIGSVSSLGAYGKITEPPLQNSLHLNAASSQYLSFSKPSSLNATGDYTFETWIKFNTIQNNGVMDPIFGGGQADYLSVYGGQFATRINVNNPCGGDRNFFSSSNFTTGTWHHIAVVRVGSTVTAYLDGIATGSTTSCTGTFLNSLSTVHIGKNTWRSGYLDAYISNMRYVVGTAVYTGNFTPPTAVFTAISGTEFLLLANDSNNPLKDSSINNISVTSYNGPTLIIGNGPF